MAAKGKEEREKRRGMGWLSSLLIIVILLSFNVFATDTVVRMRREIADVNKTLLRLLPPEPKAQPDAAAGAKAQPDAAAAKTATARPPQQKI